MVAGDFNQWEVTGAMAEADVGPTRKDRVLDKIFTNFGRAETESGTLPPLEVEPGTPGAASDHKIAYVRAALPRLRSFEWVTHQYRYYNDASVNEFGRWLAGFDREELVQLEGSNTQAEYYQWAVTEAMDRFFPLLKVRRKSNECPWINAKIRKLIANRKGIYWREGRSGKWRRLKKVIDKLILKRKEAYLQSQRKVLLVDDSPCNFFRNIKAFKSKDRPRPFDVCQLFPGG